MIRSVDGGVALSVRVHPGASLEGVVGTCGDAVRIALHAPAVDGANEALARYLAELFRVPRLSVVIASGHASRTKVVRVAAITADEALARLQMNA